MLIPNRFRSILGWVAMITSFLKAGAGEFNTVVAELSKATTLAGIVHSITTNPDGSSINFWRPELEGTSAKRASLSNPHIAAADAYGNIYVADKGSHAILKIDAGGLIHTFAGTHVPGFNGDGPAPANTLQISAPNGLFVFPDGTVYLLDPGNHRIRRVDASGVMSTVVNDPDPGWTPSGRALWVSPDQTLIYFTHEYPPIPPSAIASGAVVKKWTSTEGIKVVCEASVGFRNPGNIAVNPVDGKLYVTDRAEEDLTRLETGVYRIDGFNQRTRITGGLNQPKAASGQLALGSFIEQPRGIAFLADGSYFLCSHKGGDVWFVDTQGVLHQYIQGSGKGDTYLINDGDHPPLTSKSVISQPRAVTLAPNGDLIVVCNDSGYLFRVRSIASPPPPTDLRLGVAPQGVLLKWTGIFGKGYRVERTSDLRNPTWISVGAVSGMAGAESSQFHDNSPLLVERGFYRLLPSL